MKKLLIIIFTTTIIMLFAGCSNENNVPVSATQYQEALSAKQTELFQEIGDEEFWLSAVKISDNLSKAITEHRKFSVQIICRFYDEDSIKPEYRSIDIGNRWELQFIGGYYNDIIGKEISCVIAENDYIRRCHEAGYTVEVIGGILNWSYKFKDYGLCDYDGDGAWDLAADGYINIFSYIAGQEPSFRYEDNRAIWVDCFFTHPIECDDDETFESVEKKFAS